MQAPVAHRPLLFVYSAGDASSGPLEIPEPRFGLRLTALTLHRSAGPVRVLLFDMMDTLIDEPFYPAIQRLLPQAEQLRRFSAARRREAFLEFELGRISEREYFRSFYRSEDWKEQGLPRPEKLKKALMRELRFRQGMAELLAELGRQPGLRSGIASNYGEWYQEIFKRLPALEGAHFLFFSCEMGRRKPDPEYFAIIEQSLCRALPGLLPGAIFFADDRQENLSPAADRGWTTMLATADSEALAAAARQFAAGADSGAG
ncbi:MAG: hypothetical protein K1X75_01395 [Leptospirales bacterium]|nr:hypothetical protein [Leptospirales bacterium]